MDKKENIKKILEKIQEAEYVLVGLGQYFDMQYFLSMQEGYREIIEKLQESHALWMEPYVDTCCRKQFAPKLEDEMTKGLQNLAEILEKKSYFVVSTSTNRTLREIPWKKLLIKKERYVNPCGEWSKLQCPDGCPEGLLPVTDNEEKILRDWYQNMKKEISGFPIWESVQIVARNLFLIISMRSSMTKRDTWRIGQNIITGFKIHGIIDW